MFMHGLPRGGPPPVAQTRLKAGRPRCQKRRRGGFNGPRYVSGMNPAGGCLGTTVLAGHYSMPCAPRVKVSRRTSVLENRTACPSTTSWWIPEIARGSVALPQRRRGISADERPDEVVAEDAGPQPGIETIQSASVTGQQCSR